MVLLVMIQKHLKPEHIGTNLRVLSKSFPMNTNMIGVKGFSKIILSLCFGQN